MAIRVMTGVWKWIHLVTDLQFNVDRCDVTDLDMGLIDTWSSSLINIKRSWKDCRNALTLLNINKTINNSHLEDKKGKGEIKFYLSRE